MTENFPAPKINPLLSELSFCILDLETTGSLPEKDRIIDIGLVKMKGGKIIEEKSFLVNPGVKIPIFIQRLTKIYQKDVENCPTIDHVIDDIINFIGSDILVAHNISFDIPFLNGVMRRLKKPRLKNRTLCTHVMTKYLLPEIISSNLKYLNKLFKLPPFKPHRALEDARMTAYLLQYYLEFFTKRGLSKINHLYYPINKFEFHKRVFPISQKNQALEMIKKINIPFYMTIKGEQGLIYSAFPIHDQKEEREFIHQSLKLPHTQTISIQLLSNYYEGLNLLKKHLQKIRNEEKKRVLKHLQNLWKVSDHASFQENFDFILAPHLIKEQFVLYPRFQTHKYKPLIYKLPSHHKKLAHQAKKMGKNLNKKRHTPLPPSPLSTITHHYFCQNNDQYLFLNKDDFVQNFDQAWKKIDNYLKLHKKTSSFIFPFEHI